VFGYLVAPAAAIGGRSLASVREHLQELQQRRVGAVGMLADIRLRPGRARLRPGGPSGGIGMPATPRLTRSGATELRCDPVPLPAVLRGFQADSVYNQSLALEIGHTVGGPPRSRRSSFGGGFQLSPFVREMFIGNKLWGGSRNRTFFAAIAGPICPILLVTQAYSATTRLLPEPTRLVPTLMPISGYRNGTNLPFGGGRRAIVQNGGDGETRASNLKSSELGSQNPTAIHSRLLRDTLDAAAIPRRCNPTPGTGSTLLNPDVGKFKLQVWPNM
jgi:hypothetical protein